MASVNTKRPKTRLLCCSDMRSGSWDLEFLKAEKISVGANTNFVFFDICSPSGFVLVNGKKMSVSLFTKKEPLISTLLDYGPIEIEQGTKVKMFFNPTFLQRMKHLRTKPLKGDNLFYHGGMIHVQSDNLITETTEFAEELSTHE